MTESWQIIKDVPDDHRLPFAQFICMKNNIDSYSGLAIFHGVFSAVEWFSEWEKTKEKFKGVI